MTAREHRRSVWISGGGNGIGRELVIALLKRGWRVSTFDIDSAALETLVDQHGDQRLHTTVADISVWDQVSSAFAAAEDALGPIDAHIGNALHAVRGSILELEPADWRHVIEVGLNGYFYCSKLAAASMVERGYGRILNMSSGSAERGIPATLSYAAAKGGVNSMTRAIATDLATSGVTANLLTVGPVLTESFAGIAGDEAGIEARRQRVPLGRLGKTTDFVGLVELLLSPESAWITGALFHVDGGANNAALVQQV